MNAYSTWANNLDTDQTAPVALKKWSDLGLHCFYFC